MAAPNHQPNPNPNINQISHSKWINVRGQTNTTLYGPDGSTGSSYVTGIYGNEYVGYYWGANRVQHGFLYNGAYTTTLDDPLGIGTTYLMGISGTDIVGYFQDSEGDSHGFLLSGTTYITLDDPLAANPYGGGGTFATGIYGNDIVGYYGDSAGN
jgi:hypothetical protein